jgi:hypothetical protein
MEARVRKAVRAELDRLLDAMSATAGQVRAEAVPASAASAAAHVVQAVLDGARTSPGPVTAWPGIQGRCPACGHGRLFVGSGGYLTCPKTDCPMPDAASRLLLDHAQPEHHVTIHVSRHQGDRTFTIRHPLMDRLAGTLEDCSLHQYLTLGQPVLAAGGYIAGQNEAGVWVFFAEPDVSGS